MAAQALQETQFLNKVLSDHNFKLISDNNINESHFIIFKNEFKFILNHYKQYQQVPDLATFVKAFPEFEVQQVTESPDYLVKELYRGKDESYAVDIINKSMRLLTSGKTEEAINLLSSVAQNAASNKHMEAIDILSDTSRYSDYLDKCNDFDRYYIPTSFRELDAIIGGFDRNEELAVIAARSGVGKSWVLLKCITAALNKGLTIGLYSGEMSANKVGYRLDTLMSHISNSKLMHGDIEVANSYKTYLDAISKEHKGKLLILTRDMVDGDCGVNTLRSFVEKYKLDALFIDQHSLLDDDHHARNPIERAANISKDLKILQTQKHIPIIAVSQQNREKIEEGQMAGTENISQSDRIAQDATLILFLTQKDGVLTISIGKSRDGGTGATLKYEVDIDKGKFTYIPDGDSEDEERDEF